MNNKLCIYFCDSLLPEVNQLLRSEAYPDVRVKGYAATCNSGNNHFFKTANTISKEVDTFSRIVILAGTCGGGKKMQQNLHPQVEIITYEPCFGILLNHATIYHYIQQGSYLVTNGWLKQYKRHIKEWGFSEASAKAFFGESIKKILLLETGLQSNYLSDLKALASYMGLPYEMLPIGNSHLKLFIDTLVYKWRAETERTELNEQIAAITRESADHHVLFSQLKRLIDLTDEHQILKEIATLLDILFMPEEICFLRNDKGIMDDPIYFKQSTDDILFQEGDSFEIDVRHRGESLGRYQLKEIKFPTYMRQYESMKLVISQIGGLAIVNARKYTELEHANQLIETSEAELRELNATKDKFFSIIAHDLKSPFNSIIGFSELLADHSSNKDHLKVQKYAGIILKSSQRALELLSNLLEWSGSQTGKIQFNPESFNLANFIKEIIPMFDDLSMQKSISVKTKIPPNMTIYADKHMISTVMRNLVSNAIKFTREHGEVVILAAEKQNKLCVSVRDNGMGIAAERIDRLFRIDQNNSTPGTANEKGTGLGLILCKEFVEHHGGNIWVTSIVNEGSEFSFSVPRQKISIQE